MGLFQKLFGKSTINLTKVFPRIKGLFDEETLDPNLSGYTPVEMNEADRPVYEPFAEGLGIFYALDKGDHFLHVQNRHLSETITLEKLRETALNNMTKEVSDKTQISGDPSDIMMLINGGNFEAAMMLVDSIWDNLEQVLNDQVCIAIPAKDLLFIAGKNNPVGRESLRARVRQFFDDQETEGLLVRHIYTRENNQWVLLETA